MGRTEILASLRTAGCRMTAQRAAIVDAIVDRPGHFTAETIFDCVRDSVPYLDLSTIYRTLITLRDLGVLTETTDAPGLKHFEMRESELHHHLVCTQCGRAAEIDDDLFESLRQAISDRYGFQASIEHRTVPGLCAECAALNRVSEEHFPSPTASR